MCVCVYICISILWLEYYTAIKNDTIHTQKMEHPNKTNAYYDYNL